MREEAEKENNFIYHCVIPAPEKLEPIGVAAVAKAAPYKRGDLLTPADKAIDFFEAVQPIEGTFKKGTSFLHSIYSERSKLNVRNKEKSVC